MLALIAWLATAIPDIRLPTTVIAQEGLTDHWARYTLCTSGAEKPNPFPCVKPGIWTALCYPALFTGWGIDRDKNGKLVAFTMRIDSGKIAPIAACPFSTVMVSGDPPSGPHVSPAPADAHHEYTCDKLRSVPAGAFCFDFTWRGATYTYGIHPTSKKLHASRSRGQEVVELAPLAAADAPTDQDNPTVASCQALGDVDGNGAPELLCGSHEFGYAPDGSVRAGNHLWWVIDLGDALKRLRWGMSAPWRPITSDNLGAWAKPVLDLCLDVQSCDAGCCSDDSTDVDNAAYWATPPCDKLKQRHADLTRQYTDPIAQTALRGPCKPGD